eukprot:g2733.t1
MKILFATIAMTLMAMSVRSESILLKGSPPGMDEDQCFKSYGGYLPVGNGKFLYHMYMEATSEPEKKPVVLWLNGGPGCSSFGGLFTELGPYVVDKDMKVTTNPYSWNKVANMIFVEQPAGVGFSYPAGTTNDTITAGDTYEALVQFFKAHPNLDGRPFYIAGESYGGHYVPNTALAIESGNAAGKNPKINLKGFAVGNGYTDWQLDFNANVENGRFHALTSQSHFDEADKQCSGNFARCFWPREDVECPKACGDAVKKTTEYAMNGDIDIYDIYVDICLDKESNVVHNQMSTLMSERRKRHGRRDLKTTISPIFDTCADNFAADYLNSDAVRKWLGIRDDTVPNGKWSDCGNVDYHFNYESEIPHYLNWAKEGNLNILIYNGDADYILSHMGNSAWVRSLNLTQSRNWTQWKGSDRQVAGYFEQYAMGTTEGSIPLTFLTVKGAGHMVPKDRPRHALDMLAKFIQGGGYDNVDAADYGDLCPGSDKSTSLKPWEVAVVAIATVAMVIVGMSLISYMRRTKSSNAGDLAYVSVDD